MIAGVVGYDSIRKHLAECGYHTAEIREKSEADVRKLLEENKIGTDVQIKQSECTYRIR